ncbi:spermidine synthase [Brevundimonas mediterranea]|uniref:SAM-dependent methyltransferase n=1 Tax=Brevundimonas mediterranea TaxID=74329 RepID=A0A7W6A3U0_9CAUL|nr:fused MFS/spermidine synthase [Brevundimonas mediterranea]MBB3871207.1 SAM-dependent methyltransferase [Brevundimonas mediterranea]
MTDVAEDPVLPLDRPARATAILFAVAVFTSACLVFVVQPMATKLILPTLGGSPSVWNAAMVFFQTALLAGYGYAHLLQRIGSMRRQVAVHLGLLLIAALFIPLRISGLLGDPDPSAPTLWMLATLALSLGAPFAVLSATAPLLQAWYARASAGRVGRSDPYVLYAASNLGSFLALLAYPVLIEPLVSLSAQRWGWTLGYGLFVLMVVGLGLVVWRRRETVAAEPAPLAAGPRIVWREKGLLILLAAAPSSLMLGVTAHLSTDVASAPFLWVIPLALYLLTFVIAFQARPIIPLHLTLAIQAGTLAACAALAAFRTTEWLFVFGVNLTAFFFTALMCHQRMAERRPAPGRLTEFYLLLSLGGVLGGVFNALIAPVVFDMVWEYPLVLVAVGLLRPWGRREMRSWEIICCVVGVLIAVAGPLGLALVRYAPDIRAVVPDHDLVRIAQAVLGVAALFAFLLRDRAVMFTVVIGAMVWSGYHVARGYDWVLTERSFFGVMRVASTPIEGLDGPVHVLMHGTTLHGAQAQAARYRCMPTLYYATSTPLGQAALMTQAEKPGGAVIGIVGQGSGAMAAYKRAQDRMSFFEIDPMVDRLSRDPRWFSFINGCAEGPIRTVLGDARLMMEREAPASYDLLIIDAFSSDAVPTHLLTVEAIAGYLRLLKPEGVVVLHLSNRNLEITLPAEAAAVALKAPALHQIYIERRDAASMSESSTEALIVGKSEAALAPYRQDPRWRTLEATGVRPWTDDYVNLFGALVRQMQYAVR